MEALFTRDLKRCKPYTKESTVAIYKEKIHNAVTSGGQYDPYTGEPLAWELISTWDTSHSLPIGRLEYFSF